MGVYYSFAQKRFRSNAAYRFENFTGIFYSLLIMFVYITIFRAFVGDNSVDGVTVPMLSTNFVLTCLVGSAYDLDEIWVSRKIQDGSIAVEFLRPVNIKYRMLAENIGDTVYAMIYRCLPAVLISMLFFQFQGPESIQALIMFLLSLCLGYLIYWSISFLVQISAFFIINVRSVATIKDALIHILAGVYLPMWAFPDGLRHFIAFTPFEGIFFLPIEIYFGRAKGMQILISFGKQFVWLVILWLIGNWMMARARKKMIVQGG